MSDADAVSEVRADAAAQIRALLAQDEAAAAQPILAALPLSEALRELLHLSAAERDRVLAAVDPALAAALLDEAPNELAVELIERLEPPTAAGIIDALDSNVQADLIGELKSADAEAILQELDAGDAALVRRLLAYEDDTAGGLMTAGAFTFRASDTVRTVLQRVLSDEEDFQRYRGQHPYVIDDDGRPVGVLSLRALLTSPPGMRLANMMVAPLSVPVDTKLDALHDLFAAHAFFGFPVVEKDGRLVGVVARTAVDEAALERAESDSLKRQGVPDELRSMPLWLRSRRRLAWLSANIVLNIIAASVIAAYEETLAAVIAIAIFLPMVSDMSGCSGNQAVAVSMRELSLGLARPRDAFRVWLKEVSVGLINGLVLGILIGLVAWAWKGSAWLGLVIGLALGLNTIIAVSIGGVVPLILKGIGQDPAVASGPLLTTVTDICGFFLVLSLAALFMSRLV